jgi:hypothetical protein
MHTCGHPYAKLIFITCIGEGLLDILYVEILSCIKDFGNE